MSRQTEFSALPCVRCGSPIPVLGRPERGCVLFEDVRAERCADEDLTGMET